MIFSYNKEHVGDVLMIILSDKKDTTVTVERKGNIARVFDPETNQTLAWNIFEVSSLFSLVGNGQVFLSEEQIAILNQEFAKEGFTERFVYDAEPKFVVAQIKEMIDHPDSDHLHICQVEIQNGKLVQIVCGAPNAAEGLKTVAALPGAMMPNGALIFPGELRGESSYGMLCSPRELELPNAPQQRGIIELDAAATVGEAFDPEKHWQG